MGESACSLLDIPQKFICLSALLLTNYDFTQIPAFTQLPSCVQSNLPSIVQGIADCVVAAVEPENSITTSYPVCACSHDYALVQTVLSDGLNDYCSPLTLAPSVYTPIFNSYCLAAAGGYVTLPPVTSTSIPAGGTSRSAGRSPPVPSMTTPSSVTGATLTPGRSIGSFTETQSSTTSVVAAGAPVASTGSSGLSTGATIGTAIGVLIGLSLLICIPFMLFRRRKPTKESGDESDDDPGRIQDYEMHRFFTRFNMHRNATHNRT